MATAPGCVGRVGQGVLLGAELIFDADTRAPVQPVAGDDLADHVAVFGTRPPTMGHSQILARAEQADLRGRGGAFFPMARKWRTALAAAESGREVVVVCNAAEGEPASVKDVALLLRRPHLALDGLHCAAEALGASTAVVWIHQGSAALAGLRRAVAERRAAGWLEPPVRIVTGPPGYLSGEGTAVVGALNGGPAVPVFLGRPSAQGGLDGRPTVVQNVETLARLALLARSASPDDQPGVLVSVLTADPAGRRLLAARELPGTATITAAVTDEHWSRQPLPRAILVGGFGGRWMRWDAASALTLGEVTRPASGDAGTVSIGAGILAPIPRGRCGVSETAAVMSYLAEESAGQCGPCVFGTRALAQIWARLARGKAHRSDLARLAELEPEMAGRGACRLPDAAVGMSRSALEVFAFDVGRHATGLTCAADPAEAALPLPAVRMAHPWSGGRVAARTIADRPTVGPVGASSPASSPAARTPWRPAVRWT